MRQGIAKAGSSSSYPVRQCTRCLRIASTRIPRGVNRVYHQRRFSSATTTESTISIDDSPIAYSASAEAGPSRDRMRNVWSQSKLNSALVATDKQLGCKNHQKDNVF
jgi:hypothetical protein